MNTTIQVVVLRVSKSLMRWNVMFCNECLGSGHESSRSKALKSGREFREKAVKELYAKTGINKLAGTFNSAAEK